MSNVRNDEKTNFGHLYGGQQPYSDLIAAEIGAQMRVKAELAALIVDNIGRAAEVDRGMRLSCVHIAQEKVGTADEIISFADALAQYVLTGKKPGES